MTKGFIKRKRIKIFGTTERPRLSIFRSLQRFYAQIVNDETGKTLVFASTLEKDVKKKLKHGDNMDAAKYVGEQIGKKAIQAGIKKVVFDRGTYRYHGRIKALADAARSQGLEF